MRKSFNEVVRLEPAVDKYLNDDHDIDMKNIQWKFNNLSAEYVHLNVSLFLSRNLLFYYNQALNFFFKSIYQRTTTKH